MALKFKYILIVMTLSITLIDTVIAQSKSNFQKEMIEYNLKENLSSELNKIIQRIKMRDSQLIFFINIEKVNCHYSIFISTDFEINPEIDYKGFFYLKNKLFLITNEVPKTFFNYLDKKKINFELTKKNNAVLDSYIDDLPIWTYRFENDEFISVYSSY